LGGALTVESAPGVGSTFTATIATGEISELDLQTTSSLPTSDVIPTTDSDACELTGTIPQGCRVLLVEDGDTNRRLIHKMLERHGIEVTDAVNGQMGVELATTREFDVILMDMQMPIKDGYTAATELRSKGLTIPIVALTAHAMTGDAEKCRRAGCSEYLAKPIQEARLLAKLAELLGVTTAAKAADCQRSMPNVPDRLSQMNFNHHCDEPDASSPSAPKRVQVACALPLDDDVFREIVAEFSEKLRAQVDRMKMAYASEQWDELVQLAHWLKGSGGTAGYEQFTIPSGRLERLAGHRSHSKIEAVLNEIDELAKAVAEEVAAVTAFV
jgi:CheY-like chemotaxis protein/HPt (histidine-containing phosphotransfer) domain-containing protein